MTKNPPLKKTHELPQLHMSLSYSLRKRFVWYETDLKIESNRYQYVHSDRGERAYRETGNMMYVLTK